MFFSFEHTPTRSPCFSVRKNAHEPQSSHRRCSKNLFFECGQALCMAVIHILPFGVYLGCSSKSGYSPQYLSKVSSYLKSTSHISSSKQNVRVIVFFTDVSPSMFYLTPIFYIKKSIFIMYLLFIKSAIFSFKNSWAR